MSDWPPLSILVITYNRWPLLLGTLQHLREHRAGKHWIVADDGSGDGRSTQRRLRRSVALSSCRSERDANMGARGFQPRDVAQSG
jgi:glycosyltransferase involved in cell wall biosynthesis